MFRFANPQYLWLLLAIPALVLIFWAAAARRRKRLARFGNPEVLEELMPEVSTGRTALKFILFCTAAVLLIRPWHARSSDRSSARRRRRAWK